MQLRDWAHAPSTHSPPVPLHTDVVAPNNPAYRVGLIPRAAIADDLAALGLTYATGRGLGYQRNGARIDTYDVGELIAEVFADTALGLRYFLDTDENMSLIRAETAARDRLHYRDGDTLWGGRRAAIQERIDAASAALAVSLDQLELAHASLAATAKSIAGFRRVRDEAVRRFRPALSAPVRKTRNDGPAALEAFLVSYPHGAVVHRPTLHAEALAAGLDVGSQSLYAAAYALGWSTLRRKGQVHLRVA